MSSEQWLNADAITNERIEQYQSALQSGSPSVVIIDDLFDEAKLSKVLDTLQRDEYWVRQRHSYSQLYVDDRVWSETPEQERFVQRDSWQPRETSSLEPDECAILFSEFLRSDQFLALLSSIFRVTLTDKNVSQPAINTNYFRLGEKDFVGEHADQSPGREVCLLLYLNKNWQPLNKGQLCFRGDGERPIKIAPKFNRSVLFDPSSTGSEHWIQRGANEVQKSVYRYNITSWYWRE